MNRPANHMPCSPDEATVAVLGEAMFRRKLDFFPINGAVWEEINEDGSGGVTQGESILIRYGATFWKPVPNPPENTRELTEEEMALEDMECWLLTDNGSWKDGVWFPNVFAHEPWRFRVPIEKKVVAWSGNTQPPSGAIRFVAWFDHEEDRDRAVKDANERANGRES